jgi:predicted O-methyltransferase YrrM
MRSANTWSVSIMRWQFSGSELDAIYASHPVSERNIRARLERQNIPQAGLTEWSLAIDPDTEISDQNHPGGVQSVLALGTAAHISAASVVLDVGAGIGGSARVLAQVFGCSVVGIERDRDRCQEALRLTALVRMSDRVRFLELDALSAATDIRNADVLWGQSAWVHFPSPEAFLDLWLPAIRAGGRVAMSDAFLRREPADDDEIRILRELESAWGAHLVPVNRWQHALETRTCAVVHIHDRTEEARAYFKNIFAVSARWPIGTVTRAEKDSWVLASTALDRGLIVICQLVAVKRR